MISVTDIIDSLSSKAIFLFHYCIIDRISILLWLDITITIVVIDAVIFTFGAAYLHTAFLPPDILFRGPLWIRRNVRMVTSDDFLSIGSFYCTLNNVWCCLWYYRSHTWLDVTWNNNVSWNNVIATYKSWLLVTKMRASATTILIYFSSISGTLRIDNSWLFQCLSDHRTNIPCP